MSQKLLIYLLVSHGRHVKDVNMASAAPGKPKNFICSEPLCQAYQCGHSLDCGAVERSCRTQGSLITVARYVYSKHYSLKRRGVTTLALYRCGVYMEHIGKAKTKFYNSSTNIYSSLIYKRKGNFLTYFSFISPSTQSKG